MAFAVASLRPPFFPPVRIEPEQRKRASMANDWSAPDVGSSSLPVEKTKRVALQYVGGRQSWRQKNRPWGSLEAWEPRGPWSLCYRGRKQGAKGKGVGADLSRVTCVPQ